MKRNIWKSIICSLLIVAMLAASAPAFAASSVVRIMKVNASNVRLREKDSLGSTVIGKLKKGTKVLCWGEKDDAMYKVMTSSGKVGYVYKEYLTTYGAMRLNKVCITTGATKMYNSSLKHIGTLAKGKYVVIYKTSGNWAYIKTMSGKSAFVRTDTLKKAF